VAQLSVEKLGLKKASTRTHGSALPSPSGTGEDRGVPTGGALSPSGKPDPQGAADSAIDLLPVAHQRRAGLSRSSRPASAPQRVWNRLKQEEREYVVRYAL
jgi:hypothetical protein